jgi:hypothetical protein
VMVTVAKSAPIVVCQFDTPLRRTVFPVRLQLLFHFLHLRIWGAAVWTHWVASILVVRAIGLDPVWVLIPRDLHLFGCESSSLTTQWLSKCRRSNAF